MSSYRERVRTSLQDERRLQRMQCALFASLVGALGVPLLGVRIYLLEPLFGLRVPGDAVRPLLILLGIMEVLSILGSVGSAWMLRVAKGTPDS